MSQPSVINYFSTRKRLAHDELKSSSAKKVLILDNESVQRAANNNPCSEPFKEPKITTTSSEVREIVVTKVNSRSMAKKPKQTRIKKIKQIPNQTNLQTLPINTTSKESTQREVTNVTPKTELQKEPIHVTPPSTPTKRVNAMDKVKPLARELSFNELKQRMSRSSRLAELKASISKFKQLESKLEEAEKKTAKIEDSPNLKSFKTIELEVALSPTKTLSPEKVYLSPKKNITVKKNLLNLLSPTKNAVALPSVPAKLQILEVTRPSLTLPFKYRCLLEFFRNIDTVMQIMFNRKETITFRKLKPAVEELFKRNLYEKHLSQIKSIYPNAFNFKQEKLRAFGAGLRQEQWELVVEPKIDQETMSSDILLERRRKFHDILLEKTITYHTEFLLTLEPPMNIPMNKLKRWHPEFNLETLPDIEEASLPQAPQEENSRNHVVRYPIGKTKEIP
ncbi:hypothetical protein AMK59_3449 [Oryctes borbonicus]|uniref:CDT1 Geminin-binding domain-containing protein n=1 Tax=Oryctes borbonicus TaxID=1629725 RepID=A0A0T6B913_9SCAR|nr:hypothetical protein AMK59_3449 [Oryctes borbonicus]